MQQALLGMSAAEMGELLAGWGEPRFRGRQLARWLYGRKADTFEAMTDLPRALRERLAERCRVGQLGEVARYRAADGTQKFLLRTTDGQYVETVLIPEGSRRTACLSTQVGCGIGCVFCATGLAGLTRNLTAAEIVEQLVIAARHAEGPVTHVVFMGMGEPLANYDATLQAVRLITAPDGLGLSARRLTVSTSGLVPRIRRLAREGLPLVLAVSLHATTDELRRKLVPIARRYPLDQLLGACREYAERTGRRVTLEYVLLAGVNDTPADAARLGALARSLRAHVNLIPMNPVPETGLRAPGPQEVRAFAARVRAAGAAATVRAQRGAEIEAACGQLRQRAAAGRRRGTPGEAGPPEVTAG